VRSSVRLYVDSIPTHPTVNDGGSRGKWIVLTLFESLEKQQSLVKGRGVGNFMWTSVEALSSSDTIIRYIIIFLIKVECSG